MATGPEPPYTEVLDYGSHQFAETGNPHEPLDASIHTSEVMVRAHPDNDGLLTVGWDEDISPGDGIPLEAGDAFSFSLDNFQEQVFIVADTVADELSYVAME